MLRDDAKYTQCASFTASSRNSATIGSVTDVLPLKGAVVARFPGAIDASRVLGQVAHFVNDRHRTAHTIAKVEPEQDGYVLTFNDDLIIGAVKVEGVQPQSIATSTAIPLSPSYRGASLTDELFRDYCPIQSAEGTITLAKPWASAHGAHGPLKKGDTAYVLDVAPGDSIEIPWVRYTEGEPKP